MWNERQKQKCEAQSTNLRNEEDEERLKKASGSAQLIGAWENVKKSMAFVKLRNAALAIKDRDGDVDCEEVKEPLLPLRFILLLIN